MALRIEIVRTVDNTDPSDRIAAAQAVIEILRERIEALREREQTLSAELERIKRQCATWHAATMAKVTR